jgi:hypothetical protein
MSERSFTVSERGFVVSERCLTLYLSSFALSEETFVMYL